MSRVETKVWAAVVGAGGGTVIGNAVLWILGVTAWGAPSDAAHAKQALDAVPPYIASLITLALATVGTFFGGFYAPPSNHAGNATGGVMDDSGAGHEHLSTASTPATTPAPDPSAATTAAATAATTDDPAAATSATTAATESATDADADAGGGAGSLDDEVDDDTEVDDDDDSTEVAAADPGQLVAAGNETGPAADVDDTPEVPAAAVVRLAGDPAPMATQP